MKKLALALFAMFILFSLGGCYDPGFMKDEDIKDIDTITGSITFGYRSLDDDDEPQRYTIAFELYYKKAPITVTNFVKLAKSGFYNDTYCSKFSMAEGSEYFAVDAYIEEDDIKKQKSLEYYIKGEFEKNGWDRNDISHTSGTMAMMRSGDYDTASFEFMICLDNEGFKDRDGEYAAFGKLIEIDGRLIDDLLRMSREGALYLYDYDFRVEEIKINEDIDLGEPLKIKK
ncbi:MAG: peptidylprolyl isomerase [Clostridiales bacterium]|nr:peptidylprolyl isomerase [Clostridiales bacterium]